MKRSFMMAMLCAGSSLSFAQIDSLLAFYPLHTGDFWQYMVYYDNAYCVLWDTSYYSVEVVGDTLLSNGLVYKMVDGGIVPSRSYVRLDTALANVYTFYDFLGDCLSDSLLAEAGDLFTSCFGITECYSVDTMTIFGENTTSKAFWLGDPFGQGYVLARGFGRSQFADLVEGGTCPPYLIVHNLVYARIDSIEYGTLVDVSENRSMLPTSATLLQNYPNPFNPITTISFSLPHSEDVSLKIFNLLGEEVETLASGQMGVGTHTVQWNATGQTSGVYFYRLRAGDFVETRKLLLLR